MTRISATYESLTSNEKKALDNLIAEIKAYRVIPVIGYELFNDMVGDANIDFLRWFAKKLLVNSDNYTNSDFIDTDFPSGMDYINLCYRYFDNEFKYTSFGEEVRNICETHLNDMHIPTALIKLAKIKFFNFYIDTTILGMQETALTTFGIDRDPLKNNYTTFTPKSTLMDYDINVRDSIFLYTPLKVIKKPVIWNFFGSYYETEEIINFSDVHFQEKLYNYISGQSADLHSGYRTLQPLFQKVSFLFIGCSFKDWIFRFILRFLASDKLEDNLKKKLVIDGLLLNNTDVSRNLFITSSGIRSFLVPPVDFVDIIFQELSKQRENIKSKHSGRIFISFINENRNVAENIYKELSERFALDCFLDEADIEEGRDLNQTIIDGIDNCSVFVPLVTNQMDSGAMRNSVAFAEWNYACQKANKKELIVMPIYTKDYDRTLLLKFEDVKYDAIRKIIDKVILGGILEDGNQNIPTQFASALKSYQIKSRRKDG